jgi:hypothetical protein
MKSNLPFETISFVPTDNCDEVAHRIRDWVMGHAFMGLKTNAMRYLEGYTGGHLNLELGGYVQNPERPERQATVETSFTVTTHVDERLDPVEDPEGTVWHRSTFHAEANWPSYGSHGSRLSRYRADLIAVTVTLAEMFDAEFAGITVWSKGMTRAEREETHAKWARDATQIKAASHIKDAIHTSCRLMRVGDERFIPLPDGEFVMQPGKYEVCVENKTYRAEVRSAEQTPNANRRFQFRRTA